MNNVYRDKIIKMDQYSIETGEDIFERILKERKGNIDEKRFFLSYIYSE